MTTPPTARRAAIEHAPVVGDVEVVEGAGRAVATPAARTPTATTVPAVRTARMIRPPRPRAAGKATRRATNSPANNPPAPPRATRQNPGRAQPTRPHRRPPLRHVSPPCSSTKRPTITKIETETPAPLSGPIDRVEELFDAGDVARGIDSRKGDILEDLDADSETEPQGAQLLESLFALH